MPRRHTLPPQLIRLRSEQLSRSPSPVKNLLQHNNEKKCDVVGKDSDSGRYLHKKFKKVATLEETTPVAAVALALCGDTAPCTADPAPVATSPGGRYVCPYCAMACAKPSVLQKHIRAHTNERPYPCRPCGFAFKTKSNLYKHCRSRAHTLKMDVTDCCSDPSSGEDEDSGGSISPVLDPDRPNKNKIYKPKFHTLQAPATTPHHNRSICDSDGSLNGPVHFAFLPSEIQKEDSPEAGSTFPSRLALALLRPAPAHSTEPAQPLNLSQKEQVLQAAAATGGDGSHPLDYCRVINTKSGLNGFRDHRVTDEVECPDCKQTVDKLDVHLRIGCRAQSLTTVTADSDLVLTRVTQRPSLSKSNDCLSLNVRINNDVTRKFESPRYDTVRAPDVSNTLMRHSEGSPVFGSSCDSPSMLDGRISSPKGIIGSAASPPRSLGRSEETGLPGSAATFLEPEEKRRKLSPKPRYNLPQPDLIQSVESATQHKCVRLFCGQVKILDDTGGEARTLRIESGRESPPFRSESIEPKERRVLTISKTGLHSVGLTVIQSDSDPNDNSSGKTGLHSVGLTVIQSDSTPSDCKTASRLSLNPLTSITAFNPLTLPPATSDPVIVQPFTIVHGGKAIPHVPGMPGPNSLLDPILVRKPCETSPSGQADEVRDVCHSAPSVIVSQQHDIVPLSSSLPSSSKSCELSEKKFVRPTWLPLKAGTYVAKKPASSLGLAPPPVALVSPETPRPRKSYGQLYLNGHAYTYLGLKCSSKMFFCTLNKPQPIYVPLTPEHVSLSMYSNWKVVSESALSPLGLSPACVMSSYDSRNRNSCYRQAGATRYQVLHSSHSNAHLTLSPHSQSSVTSQSRDSPHGQSSLDEDPKRMKICNGGYESTEDYVYIRGRGRGKYVCEECGVRCTKPSMLKKHIRTTHSDLRPYFCKHCSFSFKTKGNLTKHMKSKAHYKQCLDLDIDPVPTTVDSSNVDEQSLAKQNALCKVLGVDIDGSSEETEEEEDEDDLPESEDEEGKMEREAAVSLLSLSEVAQKSALQDYAKLGLLSNCSRPLTYPYSLPQMVSGASKCPVEESQDEPLELTAGSSPPADITTPIDLSNKPSSELNSVKPMPIATDMNLLNALSTPMAGLSPVVPVLASPLGMPSIISDEGCALMTAYLKEKAARDTLMKQQQYRHHHTSNLRLSFVEERHPVVVESGNTLASPVPVLEDVTLARAQQQDTDTSRSVECRLIDSRSVENLPCIRLNDTSRLVDPAASDTDENCHQVDKSWSVAENLSTEARSEVEDRSVEESRRRTLSVSSMEMGDTPAAGPAAVSSASDSEQMETDESPCSIGERRSDTMTLSASISISLSQNAKKELGSSTPVVNHSAKESALGILALTSSQAAAKQPAAILPPQSKLKAEFLPPASARNYINVMEEGKSVCGICQKVFTKPSQLRLHVNIHYFERPFRCDSCGVSFRTKGHLQKHQRSISHLNKVNMNSTFGTATMSNPRPFKCTDCKIAFRIHGHLAKHLRSKMHIMRLECLGKLPFGMYAELERSGLNIHDIDTTDCHNSLESLQLLAQKLHEKDPSKLGQWAAPVENSDRQTGSSDTPASAGETSSDEDEPGAVPVRQALVSPQPCQR